MSSMNNCLFFLIPLLIANMYNYVNLGDSLKNEEFDKNQRFHNLTGIDKAKRFFYIGGSFGLLYLLKFITDIIIVKNTPTDYYDSKNIITFIIFLVIVAIN